MSLAKAQTESSSVNPVPSQTTDADLRHTAHFNSLEPSQQPLCTVERLSIPVGREFFRGFLHLPASYSAENVERVAAAAILCSGAHGGVAGPSGSYIAIGDKLATLKHGVPVLRVDYRYPADTKPCSEDVVAAMDYLENTYSINKFVLVGWSFGGAPVFTVAANEKGKVERSLTKYHDVEYTDILKNGLLHALLLLVKQKRQEELNSYLLVQYFSYMGQTTQGSAHNVLKACTMHMVPRETGH